MACDMIYELVWLEVLNQAVQCMALTLLSVCIQCMSLMRMREVALTSEAVILSRIVLSGHTVTVLFGCSLAP